MYRMASLVIAVKQPVVRTTGKSDYDRHTKGNLY